MTYRGPRRGEESRRPRNLLALLALLTATAAAAQERPLPVSPGEEERFAPATSACPAFSWTEAEGAVGYELAIYGASGGRLSEAPVLRVDLPPGASSWTPSADRCLPRGRSYAWLVRPVSDEGPGSWSAPRLFTVAAGPSSEEVTRAMEVLDRYLAAAGGERPRPAPEESRGEAPGGAEPDGEGGSPAGSGVLDLLEGASLEEKQTPTGAAALKGGLPDTSGEVYGLWGETASTGGTGVLGWATPTTGDTVGVLGQSESTSGLGVVGFTPATEGGAFGVAGVSASTDGAGVVAFNSGGGVHLLLGQPLGPAAGLTESSLTVGSSNDLHFDFANVGAGTLTLRVDGSPILTEATGGDITGVGAGAGLTGGGTSGDVSLAVDSTAVQTRVSGNCQSGQAIIEIKQDGSIICRATSPDTNRQVAPAEFRPRSYIPRSSADIPPDALTVDYLAGQAIAFGAAPFPEPPLTRSLMGELTLPEGATVTALECYIRDDDPDADFLSSSFVSLDRITPGSDDSARLADLIIASSGTPGHVTFSTSDIDTALHTVDNATFHYVVKFDVVMDERPDFFDPQFRGCSVSYSP